MGKIRFGVCIFGEEPLPKIVAQVKLTEELGYDSVWIADSQLLCRELYVTLAACALNTSRIKLAAGVTAPYTRHVSVTAGSFATLNEIAGGRLMLGISTGNSLVRTIGARPAGISELEQYVAQLTGLLGNQRVTFDGVVEGRIAWTDAPSNIPIYVAATGPRLTRAAAQMANGVILLAGVSRFLVEKGLRLVKEGARQAGKQEDQVDVICWAPASVSSDGALAKEHSSSQVGALLHRVSLDGFGEEDQEAVRRLKEGFGRYPHANRPDAIGGRVPDRFIDMLALAGTPEEVRLKVAELIKVPGFSQIVINTPIAGDRFPSLESVLKTFAEEVMAHVA
ncbi:MAG: LLM class flavin-dependent oxidoreductase [Dehalococcoidia bacterium]